jgi:3-hydroxybutyryl-CoA dehydrogenase
MNIAVLANDEQWETVNLPSAAVKFYRINSLKYVTGDTAACLLLDDDRKLDLTATELPVLLNSVLVTLKEMNAPANIVRINCWNSFLSRSTWEVAGTVNGAVKEICAALGKQIIELPDEPGFVSARVVAMIINEAYFALEDKISSKEEIDIAMKLGTNYPYGPFEWSSLIGIKNIYGLLQKLSLHDKRYLPATSLKQAALA